MGLNEVACKGGAGISLGKGKVAGCFEHSDELSGSIRRREFVGHLGDCYFEKETYGQAGSWTSCGVAA
jgi:hypothetical protein